MRIWTETEVRNLLLTNKKMVEKSLMKMYQLQTISEQATDETKIYNAVGFNKPDGIVLSRFAKNLITFKSFKSEKQVAYVRKKLLKYTRQITDIANGKIVPVSRVLSMDERLKTITKEQFDRAMY